MKFCNHPDTDSLYIDLSARVSADSQEISDGLVADYDSEGRISTTQPEANAAWFLLD